jgi:peroxiredoxin
MVEARWTKNGEKSKGPHMTTYATTFRGVRPGSPAPALELPLVGGGTFRLAEATPVLFTMLVFNRGLHCPVCRAQLSELNRRFDELAEKGIDVISISGENERRATQMRGEWKIGKVPLAYGLSESQMRDWGLFVSRAINDSEPAIFNEPALFLISPDSAVYYEAILSMPVGRPRLDELLSGIDYWTTNHYPARGGA